MRPGLSARQEECLRLTAYRTDREIAALLGISEPTVKKHVHEACQRLGVNRRKAALAILDAGEVGTGIVETVAPSLPAAVAVPATRFGYRPPPRDAYARLLMMAGLAVALAITTTTVTILVGDYHRLVDRQGLQFAFAAPAVVAQAPGVVLP